MGYHYQASGYGNCDYLIVTKKGKEEGGLPDGIVILTGQLYGDPEFKNWLPTAEEKGYHVFTAKHCDDERELTHIRKNGGIVNRFGFFITKTNMFEHGDSDYDIGSGSWFRRKNAPSFMEALKHLD